MYTIIVGSSLGPTLPRFQFPIPGQFFCIHVHMYVVEHRSNSNPFSSSNYMYMYVTTLIFLCIVHISMLVLVAAILLLPKSTYIDNKSTCRVGQQC